MSADAVVLRPVAAGCTLRLRVKPGARRTRLVGAYGGALKLEVAAAPEKGRANRAVERLLDAALDLPRRSVAVVAGDTTQDKVVEIGVVPELVRRRLEAAGVPARVE